MSHASPSADWTKPYSMPSRMAAATAAQASHLGWSLGRRLRLARPLDGSHLDVPIPDTDLARSAEDFLALVAPDPLVNHSYRSYLFGSLLARRRTWKVDAEALYVSALLHDVGLTEKLRGPEQFQLTSALEAERLLAEWEAPDEIVERVTRAIALHLEPPVVGDASRELAALHMGTGVDTIGLRRHELHPATVQAVFDTYPSHDLPTYLRAVMREEATSKPQSTTAFLFRYAQFGWRLRRSPFRSLT